METWRDMVGYKELRTPKLWIAVFGEFLGTFFLVFVGCGSVISCNVTGWDMAETPATAQVNIYLLTDCSRKISLLLLHSLIA